MVTWHQLGVIALIIVGIVLLASSALASFGAMMSDAPSADDDAQKSGCIAGAVGLACIALAIVGALL